MEELQVILLTSWGLITAVLIVLLIYRATLSSKEDDQIFIDVAEQHHFQEQQVIIAKMSRLTKPILALAVTSAVLLLASAGLWVYGGLRTF
jgi:beta-lactamase regulating signal transducer with metallopeptidase domain